MQGGADSFTALRHFIGVVEDRNDPEQLGRVKVVYIQFIHKTNLKSEQETYHGQWYCKQTTLQSVVLVIVEQD